MKNYTYAFLFCIGILLSACNSGKHYFNQRINHSYKEAVVAPKENVDSRVEQNPRSTMPVEEIASVEVKKEVNDPAVEVKEQVPANEPSFATSSKQQQDLQEPVAQKNNSIKRGTVKPAIAINTKEIKGNDKEGFILLAILAGLLIGLGLLAYFFLGTVGLILLIVFSIAAGIILVLVLLALVF